MGIIWIHRCSHIYIYIIWSSYLLILPVIGLWVGSHLRLDDIRRWMRGQFEYWCASTWKLGCAADPAGAAAWYELKCKPSYNYPFIPDHTVPMFLGIGIFWRQPRQVAAAGEISRFTSSGSCLTEKQEPGDDQRTPPQEPKVKKTPTLQKQISSKISSCSSKLTEIMAWEAKLKEMPAL